MLGVSLPNRDRADKVSAELEFGFRERIRHYGSLGQFAREPGRPVLGGLVHLCFPRGAGGYFRGCEAARLGKVFEKSPETEPVVRVPVGDVDASDALAETLGPPCQGVSLTVGHQGVNEDRLILAGDQGAAHRGPGRVVAGSLGWVACVGADRGDKDVHGKRTGAHCSSPGSVHACSSATCARAALTISSLVW